MPVSEADRSEKKAESSVLLACWLSVAATKKRTNGCRDGDMDRQTDRHIVGGTILTERWRLDDDDVAVMLSTNRHITPCCLNRRKASFVVTSPIHVDVITPRCQRLWWSGDCPRRLVRDVFVPKNKGASATRGIKSKRGVVLAPYGAWKWTETVN